ASLRSGTESGRISLGSLEASRVAQRLPTGSVATQRRRSAYATPASSSTYSHHRLLEAGLSICLVPLYYAGFSKSRLWFRRPIHLLGQPLPSGGSRGRPLREPCGSPPSSVVWVSTTAPDPSATPPVDPWSHVPPPTEEEIGSSL